MNRIVQLALAFVFAFAAVESAAADENIAASKEASRNKAASVIVLRVHHFLGEDSLVQKKLLEPLAQRLEKGSKGRLKVEIHSDMTLGGKAWDLVDQVRTGKTARGETVDIIWTAAAYTPGRFKRTEVFTLPIVHQGDATATNLAIRDLLSKEIKADYKGLKPLLAHVHAGNVFHMAGKPFASLADLKGLTIRPPGRKGAGRWLIEELGASPTKKRHPQLERALKKHQIDGALMSFRLADSMGVAEAVSSHTLYGDGGSFGTSLYLLLMNKARFDALPDDLKALIDRETGVALSREIGQIWQKGHEQGLLAARKNGHLIIVLKGENQDAVRAKQLEVLSKWAKQVDLDKIGALELIRDARRAVERNSGK